MVSVGYQYDMKLFTLENDYLKLTLSDLGASWISCCVKFPHAQREVLITTTPEQWHKQSAYFGATIGRYANRIANGQYQLNGKRYQLAQNNGENNLHGGLIGADKVRWQVLNHSTQAVKFGYIFADGEEGFGGEVQAFVEYRLEGNQLEISFNALSHQDTPLCLTNHAYFNLNGSGDICSHRLQINADRYLPIGENGIPNAPLKAVAHTSFDFRSPKTIGQDLLQDSDQQAVKGYDHAFELVKNAPNPTACLAVDDLELHLSTSYPALQLYSGNWLAGQPDLHGNCYADYAGVALEPEFFPDTPNQPSLQSYGGISPAGDPYQHFIRYQFITRP